MDVANVAEHVVEQEKTNAGQHPAKHMTGNVATAKVQVGKGQCQHHHHHAAEGIEHFFPELNLKTLRGLSVFTEVTDVLKQVNRAHAIGFEQSHRDHFGGDARGPALTLGVVARQIGLTLLMAELVTFDTL